MKLEPELALFEMALGLPKPWHVTKITFDGEAKELHLWLDFPPGSRFACPDCSSECPVYDSDSDRVWRHLNFFEHKAFLHATRYPRIQCRKCGSSSSGTGDDDDDAGNATTVGAAKQPAIAIKTVVCPWARPGSGFTLLFEAFVLLLCKQAPVHAVAALIGEHDTLLWRIIGRYVEQAHAEQDWSQVTAVGVDETMRGAQGHDYLTVFADLERGDVLFATPGKDAATVAAFAEALIAHGGQPEQIASTTMDMSPGFQKGVSDALPESRQVLDRFHVMKLVSFSLEQERRHETKARPELKKTRYLWLRDPEHLSQADKEKLEHLLALPNPLRTAQAYQSKEALKRLWTLRDREEAAIYLQTWCRNAHETGILSDMATALERESDRLLNYYDAGCVTNALLEGLNSLIQATKTRARGFRNMRYLAWITYLQTAGLQFHLPQPIPNSE